MACQVSQLSQLSVILAHHHTFAWGPSHALGEFLSTNVRELIFFEFPFAHRRLERSSVRRFVAGRTLSTVSMKTPVMPETLQYAWHFYKIVFACLHLRREYDLFVGVDCLNAVAGLIVKRLGLVRKVAFYVIDFVPQRFSNPIVNAVYHWITRIALRQADVIWNMSKRMEVNWVKFGVAPEKNILVPTGFFQHDVEEVGISDRQRLLLVLAGSLNPLKGVGLVLEALKDVLRLLPNVKLMVVGGGPYEKELRNRVHESGLSRHVNLLGYIPDHKKMLELIARGSIGLAMYQPDPNSLAWYGDPGRIKEYLAFGLPVITTNVPEISLAIHKANAGIVIPYTKEQLVDALLRLLTDERMFVEMSKNALALSKNFEYNDRFALAMHRTLRFLNT